MAYIDPRTLLIAGLRNMEVRFFDSTDRTVGIGVIEGEAYGEHGSYVRVRVHRKGGWLSGDTVAGYEIIHRPRSGPDDVLSRETFDPPIPLLGGEGINAIMDVKVEVLFTQTTKGKKLPRGS